MPVKKTTAKKVAAKTKAAPAKKTAAKKPAAKSSGSKKPTEQRATTNDELTDKIVRAIKAGEFDGGLIALDDAITDRLNTEEVKTRKAKKSTTEKKVAAAPKRDAAPATKKKSASKVIVPEPGKVYTINKKLPKLAGAKVKFVRLSAKDDTKAMLEMKTEKPGYPKGKQFVTSVSALS